MSTAESSWLLKLRQGSNVNYVPLKFMRDPKGSGLLEENWGWVWLLSAQSAGFFFFFGNRFDVRINSWNFSHKIILILGVNFRFICVLLNPKQSFVIFQYSVLHTELTQCCETWYANKTASFCPVFYFGVTIVVVFIIILWLHEAACIFEFYFRVEIVICAFRETLKALWNKHWSLSTADIYRIMIPTKMYRNSDFKYFQMD